MIPPNNHLFQPGELRWLIDHEKLALAPHSPLTDVSRASPSGNLHGYREIGVLSDDWRAARAVLAQPRHQVRVQTPEVESVKLTNFYAAGAGDLVGCWREDEGWRVSFPWTPAALVGVAAATVGGSPPMPADPFSITLEPAGLLLLMAVVDAIREARLSALLARRGSPPLLFVEADFQRQLVNGFAKDDASWSVTLLRLISPRRDQPGTDALAAGLRELAAAQLLQPSGDQWKPSEFLWRLATYWTPSLPAVAHEIVTIDGSGATVNHRHGIVLRGEGPWWTIDYEGLSDGRPKARLRSVAGDGLRAWLTSLIEMPPPPAQAQSVAVCSGCGTSLSSDDRFCPKCGLPRTIAAVKLCGNPACGQPLHPGAVFCHRCGWGEQTPPSAPVPVRALLAPGKPPPVLPRNVSGPIAPPKARPRPRQTSALPHARSPISSPVGAMVCPNPRCGKPVPAGKKFCLSCGKKVF